MRALQISKQESEAKRKKEMETTQAESLNNLKAAIQTLKGKIESEMENNFIMQEGSAKLNDNKTRMKHDFNEMSTKLDGFLDKATSMRSKCFFLSTIKSFLIKIGDKDNYIEQINHKCALLIFKHWKNYKSAK
jgi:hypothetical protein